MNYRIVLVGHCNIDGPRLQREIESSFKDAEVLRINGWDELKATCIDGAALLLVNREPVGFNEEGIDLIRDLHSHFPKQKVMLVSDYPDAQEAAVAVGALPGFGKADLGGRTLHDTIAPVLTK